MTTLLGSAGSSAIGDITAVDAGSLAAATGWQLKPEGLCRDDECVVVPADLRAADGSVDAVSLWHRVGRPVAATATGDVVHLGEGAATRAGALVGGAAPDFRLRDLAGAEHALSDQRGRKVLLVSWAPW